MKITALTENTSAHSRFGCEHGLSLYIETAKHKILFDMGQSDLFSENAALLGIDLRKVDIAVVSHGHYDHTGGLKKFLEINDTAPVYISRHAFGSHFNGTEKYIGMDPSLQGHPRLRETGNVYCIDDELCLYTCNDKNRAYNIESGGLNRKENGILVPDDFRHEQYLLITEDHKDVLISGCSHKGIMNISQWFRPSVIVGGFHFSKLPLDDKLKEYATLLRSTGTDFYTCHCTGQEQFEYMKKYMDNLYYLSTAQTIEL